MKKPVFLVSLLTLVTGIKSWAMGKDFSSIEIKYEETPNITLGQKIRIGILAKTDKGTEFKTSGFMEPGMMKAVDWTEFNLAVEGGTYQGGTIFISENASEIKNHQVKIVATYIKKPEIKAELIIPINYKGNLVVSMDGATGKRGTAGVNGTRGGNAVTGSGKASKGGNGSNGGQGRDGENGPDVEVYITLKTDPVLNREMVYIKAKNKVTGAEKIAMADAADSKISVTANGGNGGDGGQGGQGGQGGDDTYSKSSANGGDGGSGGAGGFGGKGGNMTVYMDPSTDKIKSAIDFSNEGGRAGRGGDGGFSGFKGSYESSPGARGTSGPHGQAGTKGPEINIIKQKVEIN